MLDEMLNDRIIEFIQIFENIEGALNKIGNNIGKLADSIDENPYILTGKELEEAIKQRKGG